jgi:endonuclease-3
MRADTSSLVQTARRSAEPPKRKKPATKKLPVQKSTDPKRPARKVAAKKPVKKPVKRSRAAEQARITQVLDTLDQLYPDAHCELNFGSPFELLVAVILSAQCTDDRVNMITPELFRRYPDPQALAQSDLAEVERLIYSTGFFHNKAKNIRAAAKMIVDKFGGQVPRTLDELLSLPGVARKTANVVLGTAFGIPSGVVVDTHVMRLSQRLGMTTRDEAVKIEQDLIPLWPKERWIMSAHRLIWHGRRVCNARKPNCAGCSLGPLCPSVELG